MKKIMKQSIYLWIVMVMICCLSVVRAEEVSVILHDGEESRVAVLLPIEGIPESPFACSHMIFRCWNSQEDGDGITYLPGEHADPMPEDLYAVWDPLTIHADGITLEKEIQGSPSEAESFHFVIEKQSGPAGSTECEQLEITGSGTIKSRGWDYDKEGTYIYQIYELQEEKIGWTCSTIAYTLIHEVNYDAKSNSFTLQQHILDESNQEAERILFINQYHGKDEVMTGISIEKTIDGKEPEGAQYAFLLEAENAHQPLPNGCSNGKCVFHSSSGRFTSHVWEYQGTGSWTYTIRELKQNLDHCTFDSTIYTITDTTVRKEDGKLQLHREIKDQNGNICSSIHFHNIYAEHAPSFSTEPSPSFSPLPLERMVPNTADSSPFLFLESRIAAECKSGATITMQ